MAFQLDTSGVVHVRTEPHGDWRGLGFADLTPFSQGYVEALLIALDQQRMAHYQDRRRRGLPEAVPIRPAYSWLAPETLARIIADCDLFCESILGGPNPITAADKESGGEFWRARQSGRLTASARFYGFPPLTVYLGDDGKVRFQ